MIFDRYLALRSMQKVIDELNEKGVVSKVRQAKKRKIGGVPFTYGPLAYLLKNRTYVGQLGCNRAWFVGEHKAIIDRHTFDQVQGLLKTNSERRTGKRYRTEALLTGLLFDDKGNRMSPSFTVKRGVRYGFYVSSALLKGRKARAGSRARIASDVVEGAVIQALRGQISELADQPAEDNQAAICQRINHVVLGNSDIRIQLKPDAGVAIPEIRVPRPSLSSNIVRVDEATGMRAHPSPRLLPALVRAHSWLRLLLGGQHESVESLGEAVGLHPKVIRNGIRLAFLGPDITHSILQGEQSRSLRDYAGPIALSWFDQRV